jgi:hypothetical protein
MVSIARYLAVALLLPGIAMSDSDGLFCSGKSYFALERRSFSSDGIHRLLIIPLSDEMGIGPEFTVELPDFQAHRMTCEDTQIRVYSFSRVYDVQVGDWRTYRFLGDSPCSACPERLDQIPLSHVDSAKDQALPIHSTSGRVSFELRVSRDLNAFPGLGEHTTIAKLVKLVDGQFNRSRIVYAETHFETID